MATTKLDKDIKDPAYRRFIPDQVLTASQLNDVIDHFECQDRFTRICLNGVGIACGLEITYKKNKSIKVAKGCAVTTDGDLVPFPGAAFTHAKPFVDVEAKYGHFNGINLIELFTEATNKNKAKPLDTVANLEDMVVVLYLEYFCKAETPCTSTDCDTQGEGQTAKVRVLLIEKEDAKRISNKDNDPIFDAHNNDKKFIDLPDVNFKKVILKNTYLTRNRVQVISQDSNTASYFRLKDSYRKAMQDTTVIANLKSGIDKLFTDFKVLLDTDSVGTKASTINAKITELFKLSSRNLPLDIQYRYDLLKDLIDTYNEIKCLLFDLRVVCCPEISSFPKHVLLGELEPVEAFFQCRHKFYPSPIIPHGKENFEKIRTLILRIHFMLNEYNVPGSTEMKVTPSKKASNALGKRALPYYYKTSLNLIKNWDYDKTKTYKSDENLGYQSANLSESDAIQNPLDYDLDDHDFYRIEGHLGKDYRDAIKDLDAIKTEKGLAFEIKVLSIDETIDSINPNDYECEFEDINAVLKAWRAEQNCLNAGVSKFFSGFSIKQQGEHKFYKLSKRGRSTIRESASSDTTETASTGRSVTGAISDISSASVNQPFSETTKKFLTSNTAFTGFGAVDTKAILGGFKVLSGLKFYNLDTVVLDNLEKDEDVLGSIVDKAMREKPEGSAEDIVNLVKAKIDEDEAIATWDKDIKQVNLYHTAEILAATKIASRYIPNDITEIDPDRVDKYNKTIKDLCARVERFKKNMTALLYKPETTYRRFGHEQQYELLLNQLSVNCCSTAKMKSLLAEIEIRKKKILEQKLLSKFVEKHTGLEHKAGVKPGGTFVMVYKGGIPKRRPIFPINPSFGNVLGDAVINPNIGAIRKPVTNISAIRNLGNPVIKANLIGNIDLGSVNPKISDTLNLGNLINPNILDALKDRFILPPISNISENTVVADFTLPYICCSDCSPVAFIIPKTPISLRLPVDFVCLDEDTKKIAFEVSPSDGVVTADVPSNLNGGVVQEDGKFMFDANAVSESLHGTEIKFKVNDQFTDARITVFKKPDFDFVASDPVFFKDNTIARVTFTVKDEKLPDNVTFEWDFGDDSLPDNSNEENPKHVYQLNLGDDGSQTFKVALTVTNGRCSHTVEHDITIAPVIFELNIADEICLTSEADGDTQIPFEITPEDATVKLAKPMEGLAIKENNLIFQAGFKAFNVPIRFTINGQAVGTECIARISPQARIILPPREKLVINAASDRIDVPFKIHNLNEFSEATQTYAWDFGDGGKSTLKNPRHIYRAPRDAQNGQVLSFEATLNVTSKVCGTKTFKTKVNIRVQRLI